MIERTVRGEGVQLAALESGPPEALESGPPEALESGPPEALESGPPEAPAVVLVHGYPDSKEMWTEVMARLSERFHVIAYDVRGFGGSSAPRGPRAYGMEQLAADLEAVIESLAGGKPVHLVGHDWGGIAGWELAAMDRFDGRLRSFTSIAGPSLGQIQLMLRRLVRQRRFGEVLRRTRRSWYVLALCAPGGPSLAWRGLLAGDRWSKVMQRRDGLEREPYHARPGLRADGLYGANLYRRNILMRLGSRVGPTPSRVPVQLIVPTRDRFISTGYYELAEEYAPKLVRRTVEATHWVPRSHPGLVADLIAEFVEEVERG